MLGLFASDGCWHLRLGLVWLNIILSYNFVEDRHCFYNILSPIYFVFSYPHRLKHPSRPFHQHGISLIPKGISNYIFCEVWHQITNPLKNQSHISLDIRLLVLISSANIFIKRKRKLYISFVDSVSHLCFRSTVLLFIIPRFLSTWRVYLGNDICNIHQKSLVIYISTETEILFFSKPRSSAMVITHRLHIGKTYMDLKSEKMTVLNYQIAH